MVRIDLGVNNCFAPKRWPETETWVKIIKDKIGITTVQVSSDLLDMVTGRGAELGAEVKRATQQQGLVVHSAFTGLMAYSHNMLMHPGFKARAKAVEWYEDFIRFAGASGARGVGGHIGALSVNDYADCHRRDYLTQYALDALRWLSTLAKNLGLEFFLWEPMAVEREIPFTLAECEEMLERINGVSAIPFRLCLDVGHQCTISHVSDEADPYLWLRKLGRMTEVIHLQQTDGKADHHWPFTEEYNAVGIIKPSCVVEAINESGADSVTMVLEVIHSPETPDDQVLDDVARSVEYWAEYL